MTTLTIKIDKRKSFAKEFLKLLKKAAKQNDGVEIIEEKENESPYNPEFVKKIKNAEKRGSYKEIDTSDIWGSLGLK